MPAGPDGSPRPGTPGPEQRDLHSLTPRYQRPLPHMSMLEQHEVAAYLLKRRLVSRRAIVSGRLRIADASSRNRNYRVSGGPGESYLLKQGLVADSAHSLANEVALYRRLTAGDGALAACVPRLHGHDRRARRSSSSSGSPAARTCSPCIGGGRAARPGSRRALGRALATIHARRARRRGAARRRALGALSAPPAAGGAALPQRRRASSSSRGCRPTRGWARRSTRCARAGAAEALVHRDVKWANCIAYATGAGPGRASGRRASSSSTGRWPAGAIRPSTSARRSATFSAVASSTAAAAGAVRPAAAAFWRAYVRTRRLDARAADRLLSARRATPAPGSCRAAYEHTQETPHVTDARRRGVALAPSMLPLARGDLLLGRAARGSRRGRYEVQVAAALDAVALRPPDAFLWFGRRETVDGAEDSLVGAHRAAAVRGLLRRGSATPPARRAGRRCRRRRRVRRALSQANGGRGAWQEGWRVAAPATDDGVTVVRAGRPQLLAPADEVRVAGGDDAAVLQPKELRGVSPGVLRRARRSRLRADGRARRAVLGHRRRRRGDARRAGRRTRCNGAGVAFRLELLDNPARYGRA